jgi:hypothetical protein
VGAACGEDDPEINSGGSAETESSEPATEEPTPSTGTSAPSSPTGPTEEVDADSLCLALPEAEAEALIGADLTLGRSFEDECDWETEDQDLFITIERLDIPGYDYPSADEWTAGHADGPWEQVDVGDEAYYGWLTPDLSVRSGQDIYKLEIALDEMSAELDPESDKEAEKQALISAAGQVLSRL